MARSSTVRRSGSTCSKTATSSESARPPCGSRSREAEAPPDRVGAGHGGAVPESLLTILKFCFLALLYLFLLRVVRAVWAEVAGPRAARPAPGAAASAPARRRERGSAKGVLRLRVVE